MLPNTSACLSRWSSRCGLRDWPDFVSLGGRAVGYAIVALDAWIDAQRRFKGSDLIMTVNNDTSERAVLASVLLDPSCLPAVEAILTARTFCDLLYADLHGYAIGGGKRAFLLNLTTIVEKLHQEGKH